MATIWNENVQKQQMTNFWNLPSARKREFTTLPDDHKDYADQSLTRVDGQSSTKIVCSKRPEEHGQ
ncbi:hypothetical protein AC579_3365 [Pseudocercospora musae]|uniref:Uncharacterized protein n=1 Tax=Pseudocercospora musae TaxID=113226 RepID=A0A139H3C6_9PEZI|nr:hypothetical protein AC579_3365 [Pseudocercospora musae]